MFRHVIREIAARFQDNSVLKLRQARSDHMGENPRSRPEPLLTKKSHYQEFLFQDEPNAAVGCSKRASHMSNQINGAAVKKIVATGITLVCFVGALCAQPQPPNFFQVPSQGAWTNWQPLYFAGSPVPILARVQCLYSQGGIIVEFDYIPGPKVGKPGRQLDPAKLGGGCFICFAVTSSMTALAPFAPSTMQNLPSAHLVDVLVPYGFCNFSTLPGISIAINRFLPYIPGGHPPMNRPCKGPVLKPKN
jgi:hypothetical protein